MSFTYEVRESIRQRSDFRCAFTGALIGRTGECLHNIHDKSHPDYNNPNNGLYGRKAIHWLDHTLQRDETIPKSTHIWGRDQIWNRLDSQESEFLDDLLWTKSDQELQNIVDKPFREA